MIRQTDSQISALKAGCIALLAALALAGCEPVRKAHGYAPHPDQLARVVVGQDDSASVAQKIGRPSTMGVFDDRTWYYIAREEEQQAFLAPKTVDQRVVVVEFDDKGLVASVDQYGLEDGRVIDLVTRTTPTRGRTLSVVQQLLGNIGRFEGKSDGLPGQGPK